MANDKISFGAKGVAIFPITGTANGLPTYATTPVPWAGLKNVSFESKSELDVIYADDTAYFTLPGNASGDFKINLLTIPLAVQTAILGVVLDTKKARVVGGKLNQATGLVVESTIVNDAGVTDYELYTFYNITFKQPKLDMKTREEKTEAREYELEGTVSSVTLPKVDNPVYYTVLRKSEVTDTVYNTAKTTLYIPTM